MPTPDAPPNHVLQIVTTVATLDDARRIASELIRLRLAACVQVDPAIRSFYQWKGEVHDDQEFRLTMKTTRARFDAVLDSLQKLHPYDLPEILATEVTTGSPAYLKWVQDEVLE